MPQQTRRDQYFSQLISKRILTESEAQEITEEDFNKSALSAPDIFNRVMDGTLTVHDALAISILEYVNPIFCLIKKQNKTSLESRRLEMYRNNEEMGLIGALRIQALENKPTLNGKEERALELLKDKDTYFYTDKILQLEFNANRSSRDNRLLYLLHNPHSREYAVDIHDGEMIALSAQPDQCIDGVYNRLENLYFAVSFRVSWNAYVTLTKTPLVQHARCGQGFFDESHRKSPLSVSNDAAQSILNIYTGWKKNIDDKIKQVVLPLLFEKAQIPFMESAYALIPLFRKAILKYFVDTGDKFDNAGFQVVINLIRNKIIRKEIVLVGADHYPNPRDYTPVVNENSILNLAGTDPLIIARLRNIAEYDEPLTDAYYPPENVARRLVFT